MHTPVFKTPHGPLKRTSVHSQVPVNVNSTGSQYGAKRFGLLPSRWLVRKEGLE
jgi:hypothetical protein